MEKQKKDKLKKTVKLKLGKAEKIKTDLDPKLQRAILALREGKDLDPNLSQSTEDGKVTVDVIAKLSDPDKAIAGLNIVRKIGQIVTGTVEVDAIESVRSDKNIISLKLATKLHEQLEFSVSEIRAAEDQLQEALPGNFGPVNGTGVIVGVIDYGCDFNHHNFRHADGTSRILFLWDQNGGSSSISPNGFNYGREFDTNRINQALTTSNPYQSLMYDPGDGSHGTHVLDIAAGNGHSTGRPGVAPNADILFVNIAHDDLNEKESFGNSKMLLDAADYIFSKASELGRSAVINISLGTHGGPHDGSTLAEQGFDALLEQPGRAIVISAGNSWQQRSHASGELSTNASRTLSWRVEEDDFTDNELEVWYDGDQELDVTLITPNEQKLGPVTLGTTLSILSQNTKVGEIIHRKNDPNNNDNHIDILLDGILPSGVWGIELSTDSTEPVSFHSWIERDDSGQSKFTADDDDPRYTIGSISCGKKTIAVGSYLTGVPDRELSPFSAEGPTRDGRHKPEVSAPGQWLTPFWEFGILAAQSSTQGATRKSGTSMASPHVAGLIALLMQVSSSPLTVGEINSIVITHARKDPLPMLNAWDSRYGYGRIDAIASVLSQMDQVPAHMMMPESVARKGALLPEAKELYSVTKFISNIAQGAQNLNMRVRFQLEIEPVSSLTSQNQRQ